MKKFFKKLGVFLKYFFGRFSKLTEQDITVAVDAITTFKSIVDNPVADFAVSLTKTDLDDRILQKVREGLSQSLVLLGAVEAAAASDNLDEIIRLGAAYLNSLPPSVRSMYYHKLCSLLAVFLSDEELKEFEADTLVQLAYAEGKGVVNEG